MKLQFKDQAFQAAATAAVCDVFEGQPWHDPNTYTLDSGRAARPAATVGNSAALPGMESVQPGVADGPDVGYRNAAIEVSPADLLKNVRAVPARQNLEPSPEGAFTVWAMPLIATPAALAALMAGR